MEYVQERITTLHDFTDPQPSVPVEKTAVVVPLAQRDCETAAAETVFSALGTLDPGRVVVPLRAERDQIPAVVSWLDSFDLTTTILWCTAPQIQAYLAANDLDGTAGKGRDVWLGLGVASDSEYVVVHDADTLSYDRSHVSRLLFPLTRDYEFVKGYYARIEDAKLYGRLFRLFYRPLLRALRSTVDSGPDSLLAYLSAFRYALAGEFAATGDLMRQLRLPRNWGLELGTLGDAFTTAGIEGTAQVDLGVHEHAHRSVGGPDGLGEMCKQVGETLFRILEERGIEPDYEQLPAQYRRAARELIQQYAADAAFNGFEYDSRSEHEQIQRYARSIGPPGRDTRLPAWENAPVDPDRIATLSETALAGIVPSVRP